MMSLKLIVLSPILTGSLFFVAQPNDRQLRSRSMHEVQSQLQVTGVTTRQEIKPHQNLSLHGLVGLSSFTALIGLAILSKKKREISSQEKNYNFDEENYLG